MSECDWLNDRHSESDAIGVYYGRLAVFRGVPSGSGPSRCVGRFCSLLLCRFGVRLVDAVFWDTMVFITNMPSPTGEINRRGVACIVRRRGRANTKDCSTFHANQGKNLGRLVAPLMEGYCHQIVVIIWLLVQWNNLHNTWGIYHDGFDCSRLW